MHATRDTTAVKFNQRCGRARDARRYVPSAFSSLLMPDKHYENSRLVKLYDLDSPWSIDRDFYLSLAGMPPQRILDLGCGTGLLPDAYAAKGHEVTGVDPSPAMLEMARRKPHGRRIEWVESCAQSYQSNTRFDLIVMTGHAFQVLLDDSDIMATLGVMRRHLKQTGRVVFESRNPSIDWANQWNYEMVFEHGGEVIRESRRFTKIENGRMTFELLYEFPDESLVSTSELRFLYREEIEERVIASGLRVDKLFGGWHFERFDAVSSPEMIFFLRLPGS
jgi:ubiquinone/menaquinone biosynthesis C-methylase UbiE